jgi:hypothetical protein
MSTRLQRMTCIIAAGLMAAALPCVPGTAEARTYKYTYTGTAYDSNTTGCLAGAAAKHLSFVMILATKLPASSSVGLTPLSWSFKDGVDIFTKGTKNINNFLNVGTDASGRITTWDLQARVLPKNNKVLFQVVTSFNGDYFNEYVTDKRCAGGGYGETMVPGSWNNP